MDELFNEIDWSKGYSARYYVSILDRKTFRDVDTLPIVSGSLNRSLTELRESGSLECKKYNSKVEEYIRIWLTAEQESGNSHIPLFTGLAISPTNRYNGATKSNTLECYSLLKIAQDVLLPKGWYVPMAVNSGQMLKELLSVIGTSVTIADNAPILKESIIAESNENRLSMVDKILDAINWRLRMDGYGAITIEPVEITQPQASFGVNNNDVLETSIDVTYDWYNAPNVLRCSMGEDFAEVRDEDSNSPLSIQNRGREVWSEDTNVSLGENENLYDYTKRHLKELQSAATTVSYTRRYWPGVYPGDRIRLSYPQQEIDGEFLISSQNITLGHNASTNEEVVQV